MSKETEECIMVEMEGVTMTHVIRGLRTRYLTASLPEERRRVAVSDVAWGLLPESVRQAMLKTLEERLSVSTSAVLVQWVSDVENAAGRQLVREKQEETNNAKR